MTASRPLKLFLQAKNKTGATITTVPSGSSQRGNQEEAKKWINFFLHRVPQTGTQIMESDNERGSYASKFFWFVFNWGSVKRSHPPFGEKGVRDNYHLEGSLRWRCHYKLRASNCPRRAVLLGLKRTSWFLSWRYCQECCFLSQQKGVVFSCTVTKRRFKIFGFVQTKSMSVCFLGVTHHAPSCSPRRRSPPPNYRHHFFPLFFTNGPWYRPWAFIR